MYRRRQTGVSLSRLQIFCFASFSCHPSLAPFSVPLFPSPFSVPFFRPLFPVPFFRLLFPSLFSVPLFPSLFPVPLFPVPFSFTCLSPAKASSLLKYNAAHALSLLPFPKNHPPNKAVKYRQAMHLFLRTILFLCAYPEK